MVCYVSSLAWVAKYLIVTILLNLITKVTRGLRKYKYTLRYFIPASNLVDFIVSETLMNHMLDHPCHFFTVSELLPLDHTYPMILVDGHDSDRLD